jgi:polyvinyl alcohol dehydrogenase (cytochrome)
MFRIASLGFLIAVLGFAQEGTRVFITRCMQCHDPNSEVHAPTPEALSVIPWQNIVKSLESGAMKAVGAQIPPADRIAVARYLGKVEPNGAPPVAMSGQCPANLKPKASTSSWNGWGVDDQNTRFQPAKAAGLAAEQLPSLKVKWAFGFPDTTTAYSQPTVVGGKVYTGSNDGTVYAINAQTGCLYWRFQAKSMVRDAVVIGGGRAYFGDLESNFYALDANTGKLIWQKKLDSQAYTRMTGTAKLYDGRLYVPITSQEENAGANPLYSCCTFRGRLISLKATDGSEIWSTYTVPEPRPTGKNSKGIQFYGPSGATIWSSPTIDPKRKLIYVATGNGFSGPEIRTADALVAIDMQTGAIKWSQQTSSDMFNWGCGGGRGVVPDTNCPSNPGIDVDMGGSPILLDVGNGRQLIVGGQKAAVVHAFDPDQQGKIVWQTRIGRGGAGGGVQWGMAASLLTAGQVVVFAPNGDSAGRGGRGAAAAPANGTAPVPVPAPPPPVGGLYAIDAATGKELWTTKDSCAGKAGCSASVKSPPAVIPGAVISPGLDGHIRAYEISTGKLIWDFDAAKDFHTTNGIPANGGAFVSTGPTLADGMLFVNSGGAGMAGNVLLAFSVN